MRLAAHPSVELGAYLAAPAAQQPFSFMAPFDDALFDGLGDEPAPTAFGLAVAVPRAAAGAAADELLSGLDSMSWCGAL